MLKSWIENKINSMLVKYVKSTYRKIDVNPGACRYNYKCHLNAVHEAIEHQESQIAMCMGIENGTYPYIHFVNVNDEGEFWDNTLGHWSRWSEFYLVKIIDSTEFRDVDNIFGMYRDVLHRIFPWYLRIFNRTKEL